MKLIAGLLLSCVTAVAGFGDAAFISALKDEDSFGIIANQGSADAGFGQMVLFNSASKTFSLATQFYEPSLSEGFGLTTAITKTFAVVAGEDSAGFGEIFVYDYKTRTPKTEIPKLLGKITGHTCGAQFQEFNSNASTFGTKCLISVQYGCRAFAEEGLTCSFGEKVLATETYLATTCARPQTSFGSLCNIPLKSGFEWKCSSLKVEPKAGCTFAKRSEDDAELFEGEQQDRAALIAAANRRARQRQVSARELLARLAIEKREARQQQSRAAGECATCSAQMGKVWCINDATLVGECKDYNLCDGADLSKGHPDFACCSDSYGTCEDCTNSGSQCEWLNVADKPSVCGTNLNPDASFVQTDTFKPSEIPASILATIPASILAFLEGGGGGPEESDFDPTLFGGDYPSDFPFPSGPFPFPSEYPATSEPPTDFSSTTDFSSGGSTTDFSSGGSTTDFSSGGSTTDFSSGGSTTDFSSGGSTTDSSSGAPPPSEVRRRRSFNYFVETAERRKLMYSEARKRATAKAKGFKTPEECGAGAFTGVADLLSTDYKLEEISEIRGIASDGKSIVFVACIDGSYIEGGSASLGMVGTCAVSDGKDLWDDQVGDESKSNCKIAFATGHPSCATAVAISEKHLVLGFGDDNQAAIYAFEKAVNFSALPSPIDVPPSDPDEPNPLGTASFGDTVSLDKWGSRVVVAITDDGNPETGIVAKVFFYGEVIPKTPPKKFTPRFEKEPVEYPNSVFTLPIQENIVWAASGTRALMFGNRGSVSLAKVAKHCEAGKQNTNGICSDCPAGQYKAEDSFGLCDVCSAGLYNAKVGAKNVSDCIKCSFGSSCPAGSFADGLGSDVSELGTQNYNDDTGLFSIVDAYPTLLQTDALQFETTFFSSGWPFFLAMALLELFLLLLYLPIPGTEKQRGTVMHCIKKINFKPFYPDNTCCAGGWTIYTVWGILYVIFFALLISQASQNRQMNIFIKTLNNVPARVPFDSVDSPPFFVELKLIGYRSERVVDQQRSKALKKTVFTTESRCLSLARDRLRVTVEGCQTIPKEGSGTKCGVRETTKKVFGLTQPQNLFFTTSKTSTVKSGEADNVCIITLVYNEPVQLESSASIRFSFQDPQFYTSMVVYRTMTLNNNALVNKTLPISQTLSTDTGITTGYAEKGCCDSTNVTGNAIVQGAYRPFSTGTGQLVRDSFTVIVGTVVNYVEDCITPALTPVAVFGGLLQIMNDNCEFVNGSIKEFGLISQKSDQLSPDRFYSTENVGFNFTLSFSKSPYFKHSKEQWGSNTGQTATWAILFIFGVIGMIQLIANVSMLIWDKLGLLDVEKKLRTIAKGKKTNQKQETIEMEEERK